MSKKAVSFRVDEILLVEFKKKLKKEGAKLTSVIVNYIENYVNKK